MNNLNLIYQIRVNIGISPSLAQAQTNYVSFILSFWHNIIIDTKIHSRVD